MESVWYYVVNGSQTGPVTMAELKAAATVGKLSPTDLVWQEGTADWVPARTVAGLFPSAPPPPPRPMPSTPPQPTYSISSPPPPPTPSQQTSAQAAPLPLDPEPLPLDDEPAPAKPRRVREDANTPSAGMPEWLKLIPVLLRRTFNPDPAQLAPNPDEEAKLTRSGVMEMTARKLAVWRRSVLFVAAVPCAFAALFSLIDVISLEKKAREEYSILGMMLKYLQAFAMFALPIAAVFGALAYDRLSTSAKWVLFGGLVSLIVPVLVAFAPTDWVLDLKEDPREQVGAAAMTRFEAGTKIGMKYTMLIVPAVLSLLPAVSRACVRMKLFLPESLVPGWGLVASAPLCVLLVLAIFVLIYHMVGNALLLVGLSLWVGAPLLYFMKFDLFTRPVTSPGDQATIVRTSLAVFGLIVLGMLLLIIYLFTAKFLGVTIVGFDEKTSVFRPWNVLDLHQKWIEYIGRSLFLSVFFADLILRVALSVWREERAFAGTADAASFDKTMSGVSSAVLPRGSSTPPTA